MLPRIERYDITEEIGHGGMATVYRARDTRLDRWVAVKVMHPHLRGTEQARARFSREARAVARLKHPAILEIYDYSGNDSEMAYIATELLTGPTLKVFVEGAGDVPAEIAACIGVELAEGLAAAHAQGIVHRDVKPENVLLHEKRMVKITDFGIADMLDPSMSAMTATGQLLGSPAHMAPEQVEGGETDARSDVFALGTILYWLCTGNLPFTGKNPHQVLKRVVDSAPMDPLALKPSIGKDLRDIILRCLAKAPAERYQSAQALAQDLTAFLQRVGIEDSHAALAAYLADPSSEAQRLREKVLTALLTEARKHVAARARVPALHVLDRVLALQDGHPEALRLVNALDRAARVRIIARALTGLAMTGLLVAVWLLFAPPSDGSASRAKAVAGMPIVPAKPSHPEAARPPDASPVATPVAKPAQPAPSTEPPDPKRSVRPRERAQPRPSTDPRTVIFDPEPANVSISVDGAPPRPFGPAFRMLDLSPGAHSFRFIGAHACCEDQIVDMNIPAGPGETVVSAKLLFRPARIYVVSDIPADVSVDDGVATGRTRSLINVVMDRSYTERRRISVTAPGHEAYTGSVQLRAGQVTQIQVALKPK